MLTDLLLVAAGIFILARAGDVLVSHAAALAERARISPAVVGLTVVAAGTSLPELFVSAGAALRGAPDIAMGNVVGSNIANIALILGITAVVAPLPVDVRVVYMEAPFVLLVAVLAWFVAVDGSVDRVDGGALTVALVAFTLFSIFVARRGISTAEQGEVADALVPEETALLARRPPGILLGGLVLGLGGLALGAELLVRGAVSLALTVGMTERVVGLTVVAVGTSLPELVATLVAARRDQHGMAVANITGSCIFNVLGILGITAVIQPVQVAAGALSTDLPLMMGLSAALLVVVTVSRAVTRRAGAALVVTWLVYTASLLSG